MIRYAERLNEVAAEMRGETVEWVLTVLESGCALGNGLPHLGSRHEALCARIRYLRSQLGHANPLRAGAEQP